MVRSTLFLAVALLMQPSVAFSQSDANGTFTPNIKPSLSIPEADGAIKIDGERTEAAWANAAVARNFSENFPDIQAKPPIDITVYTTYDKENLYIFYEIVDDPRSIRANLSDRDNIWQDDYVGMLLDPNRDGTYQYFIAANPFGIQGDTRIARGGEDLSFDLIFYSAGKITSSGYQVEFSIPFKSLRFPQAEEQLWAATFWITHPRDSRNTYTWASISPDDPCFPCQFGELRGIRGIKAGKNLEFLPTLTGTQSGSLVDFDNPSEGFDNSRIKFEPSLNVKYGITSELTTDLTINPDFSQIESDAAQIDVNSTFALFFPERRPFFQEGSDLFRTFVNSVYTRSINDPIAAAKVTGRFGRTSIGYINGRDNTSAMLLPFEEGSRVLGDVGKSFTNIVRAQHNFPDNSYIGALVTDRRLDEGGAGSTFGVDGVYRFLKYYQVEAQLVASRTAEPTDSVLSEQLGDRLFANDKHTAALDGETFGGLAGYFSVERSSRHWNFDIDYWTTSPSFRAENGFVTRNNSHEIRVGQQYVFYPKSKYIDRIQPNLSGSYIWNYDGLRKDKWISQEVFIALKGQTNIFAFQAFSQERFRGVDFHGIRRLFVNFNSNFSEQLRLGFSVTTGTAIARNLETPELGNQFEFRVNGTLRPTQRLSVQPSINYSRLRDRETGDNYFSGYVGRARTNYQFSRRLFARVIVQYNDFSDRLEIDPLVTYKINPFTAIFVGSTHDVNKLTTAAAPGSPEFYHTDRQFFFKLQYLFRR